MNSVDPRDNPNYTVRWTSDATAWSGFAIAQCHTTQHSLVGATSMAKTQLFLTVAGQSNVSWNAGSRAFRKLWKSGTFTYWKQGCELGDVHVEAEQEFLAIELTPEKIRLWTDGDPSFKFGTVDVLPPHLVDRDPYISRLVHRMKEDILQGCPAGRMFGESASLALISYLYGSYAKIDQKQLPAGLSPLKLRTIEDFIRTNLTSDLTLAQLASIADLSPRHFCRCFGQATGLPPHRYILLARIEKGKMRLINSGLSITEIAIELGFASSSHFSDAFRRITGVSPTKFVLQC